MENLKGQQIDKNYMQFGFKLRQGIAETIFLRYNQKRKVETIAQNSKKKDLHFVFVDLEKAFDWVSANSVWWPLVKLGVEVWLFRFVHLLYRNTQSGVKVKESLSQLSGSSRIASGISVNPLSPLFFLS